MLLPRMYRKGAKNLVPRPESIRTTPSMTLPAMTTRQTCTHVPFRRDRHFPSFSLTSHDSLGHVARYVCCGLGDNERREQPEQEGDVTRHHRLQST